VERLGGRCALEYKYDGLRMQVHITPDGIRLYSRGLEDITEQFMDVCAAVKASFKGQSAIVDGECVPIDPATHDMLPFQYISRRSRRKYDLAPSKKTQTLDEFREGGFEEKIPVVLILFDCLSLEDEDITGRDYLSRRQTLSRAFSFSKNVQMSTQAVVGSASEAEEFFMKAVDSGCEGVVAKSVAPDSFYKAGKRGFLWIKFKRDYRMELNDSLDLVIVGGFYGQGRRTGVYGALLMAAYNPETGNFETVCKLGTGFDDQALKELHQRLSSSVSEVPPDGVVYDQNLAPEVYLEPNVMLEVKGAEITHSPIHTCAKGQIKKGFGLALRFPRYTGRVRDDKTPEQATTTQEVIGMFKAQAKKGQ
jgi:DNA ligase 1